MATKVSGPRLREVKRRENVPEKYSFESVLKYVVDNQVCEKLDRELQELKRREAKSWAGAYERGVRF